MESSIKIFSMYLMIFFLFSSGVIFAISGDKIPPYCIALNKNAGWPAPNEGEVIGAIWCEENINNNNVTVKLGNDELIFQYLRGEKIKVFYNYNNLLFYYTYLYIGSRNIEDIKEANKIVINNILIYNNQNCIIIYNNNI